MIPSPLRAGVAAALAFVAVGGPAAAQGLNGFLPAAGSATLAVSHTLESYDEFWVGKETVVDSLLGEVETGTVSLWVDLGLTPDLTLNAQLAYVDVTSHGLLGQTAAGLQDRSLMLRWRFLHAETSGSRHTLVAGAGIREAASGYEANRAIALGDHSRDGLFRLVYQVQVDRWSGAWFSTEFGYDLREGHVPEGLSLYGELGAIAGPAAFSAGVTRVWADGGPNIEDMGFTFPTVDEEMIRVGGKVYVGVSERVGLAVSMFTTPKGENTGKATGTSTSLVLRI